MNKPNKSMKIKIKRGKDFDYSSVWYDNVVLAWMEFKMRLRYNSGKLSKYTPNKREQEVIGRNLNNIIFFRKDESANSFEWTMLKKINDDIKTGFLVPPGVNKRALVSVIDTIRRYWIKEHPDNVFKKEEKK